MTKMEKRSSVWFCALIALGMIISAICNVVEGRFIFGTNVFTHAITNAMTYIFATGLWSIQKKHGKLFNFFILLCILLGFACVFTKASNVSSNEMISGFYPYPISLILILLIAVIAICNTQKMIEEESSDIEKDSFVDTKSFECSKVAKTRVAEVTNVHLHDKRPM